MAASTGDRRCVSGGTLGTISAIKRSFAQANYHLLCQYRNPVRGHHLPSATIYVALIFNWAVSLWNDLVDPVCDGEGLAGFKRRANVFLLA